MKKLYPFFFLACALLLAAPARAQMSGSDSLQAKLASIFAPSTNAGFRPATSTRPVCAC